MLIGAWPAARVESGGPQSAARGHGCRPPWPAR